MARTTVAVLAAHGVDETELVETIRALHCLGATVRILSVTPGPVRTARGEDGLGQAYPVDGVVDEGAVDEYDALVLPGGELKPDPEELGTAASRFVSAFTRAGKPVAMVSAGPWNQVVLDALLDPGKARTARDRKLVVNRRPVAVDPGLDVSDLCELTLRSCASVPTFDPPSPWPRSIPSDDSEWKFLRLVVDRAGLAVSEDAARLVRAVLGVLAERLDPATADALAARLPGGLRQVVRCAAPLLGHRRRCVPPAVAPRHGGWAREVGPGTSGTSGAGR